MSSPLSHGGLSWVLFTQLHNRYQIKAPKSFVYTIKYSHLVSSTSPWLLSLQLLLDVLLTLQQRPLATIRSGSPGSQLPMSEGTSWFIPPTPVQTWTQSTLKTQLQWSTPSETSVQEWGIPFEWLLTLISPVKQVTQSALSWDVSQALSWDVSHMLPPAHV